MNYSFDQSPMNKTCPCQQQPCKCDPIVMPTKVCCVNRCYSVEQPIIVPVHTKIVNHYIPRPRYYTTYTTSEETVCHNRQGNTQQPY